MPSFALGPLSNRPPQYQNQYMLVNVNGLLRLAAVSRRALALPPELLSEIFIHCLPTEEDEYLPVTPNPKTAPLLLCGICRQWREVALTTPSLWSSISFSSELAYSQSGIEYVEFCRRWLSRAKDTPLSLCLEAFVLKNSIRSLLKIIGPLWQQWRDVEISLGVDFPKLLSLPQDGEYPFLETLSLDLPRSELPLSFVRAPKLRDVRFGVCTPQVQIPWHQITRFQTNHIEISQCLAILRNAPDLVDAEFRIQSYISSELPNTIFQLNQLHSLTLCGDKAPHSMTPTAFLNCINAPALKTLALGSPFLSGWHDLSPLRSFASRSSFQLHTLTLSNVPEASNTLIACLHDTPTLVHLNLNPSPAIINLDPVLARFSWHPTFLPNLMSLDIGLTSTRAVNVRESPITAMAVVKMLFWRWFSDEVRRLQFFRLVHKHETSLFEDAIKAHPVFRQLREAGMVLIVEQRDSGILFM
ncbi:hypothetical protein B0H13DRAFT_2495475 [Mycena leptocephala]|nr:hypothetical protein B0H13DRAFT_2495475 [Mycena leptocephala]